MSIKVVSFDLDGCFYDGKKLRRRMSFWCFKQRKELNTIREVRAALRNEIFPSGKDFFIEEKEEVAHRLNITPAEASLLIKDLLDTRLCKHLSKIGAREGTAEALSRLHKAGIKTAIICDFVAGGKLEALKLEQHPFSLILSGAEFGALKPYPGVFEHCIKELKVAANEILHIGVREDMDGKAALAAGMQSLVLNRDKLDLIKEVTKILKDL